MFQYPHRYPTWRTCSTSSPWTSVRGPRCEEVARGTTVHYCVLFTRTESLG